MVMGTPLNHILKNSEFWDFLGGPVVKNTPSNAGDSGSIPGQRTMILHAWAIKPVFCNYGACALWSCVPKLKPRAPMRELVF